MITIITKNTNTNYSYLTNTDLKIQQELQTKGIIKLDYLCTNSRGAFYKITNLQSN